VTDFRDASTEQVGVGTVVEVKNNASGAVTTYTILGGWDGDPEKHVISYKTALGSALLGKKCGDTVRVKAGGNEVDYTISAITRYADTLTAT
jgi:transcription elongation GreA/GreB family factor